MPRFLSCWRGVSGSACPAPPLEGWLPLSDFAHAPWGGDVPLFSFLLERGKWGRPARPPGWGHVRMRLDGVRGVVFEAG